MGFKYFSPGLRACELPWDGTTHHTGNPERVEFEGWPSQRLYDDATLSGLKGWLPACTQGSSQARNPGLIDRIPLGFTCAGVELFVIIFMVEFGVSAMNLGPGRVRQNAED